MALLFVFILSLACLLISLIIKLAKLVFRSTNTWPIRELCHSLCKSAFPGRRWKLIINFLNMSESARVAILRCATTSGRHFWLGTAIAKLKYLTNKNWVQFLNKKKIVSIIIFHIQQTPHCFASRVLHPLYTTLHSHQISIGNNEQQAKGLPRVDRAGCRGYLPWACEAVFATFAFSAITCK